MSDDNRQLDAALDDFTEEEVEQLQASEEEAPAGSGSESPESIEEKYSKSQLRIVRTTMDFTLHNLRQSLDDNHYITMSPGYQRRARWDVKKRSQLIESFLMNIPVPPIFLFENDYNQYEVMDGRQRLEAIRDFLGNRFALRGLEFWTELNGQRFSDLHTTLQKGLLRRTISAIVLLTETSRRVEGQVDVQMVLFRRLNTGGIKLNGQELRNALYPGKFNDMLVRIARSDLFCQTWGIPQQTSDEPDNPPQPLTKNTLYKTMADCELVLRFFAIKETIEQDLKGSLRKLLDDCMARHKGDSENAVQRFSELFSRCLGGLLAVFDGRPFMLPRTRKPSWPLYDALMVALSQHPGLDLVADKVGIQGRLANALQDQSQYEVLVGRLNTIEAIRLRVQLAEDILLD